MLMLSNELMKIHILKLKKSPMDVIFSSDCANPYNFAMHLQQPENREQNPNQDDHEESMRPPSKKDKSRLIRKKPALREITHYFTRIDKHPAPSNKNIPTPDKAAIEQMDQRLARLQEQERELQVELDEWRVRKQRQKEESENYLGRARAMLAGHLRKSAYIERTGREEMQKRARARENQIGAIKEVIETKKELLRNLNGNESYFIKKDIVREEEKVRMIEMQLEIQREKARLAHEETICFMAKQKWGLIGRHYLALELVGRGGFSEVYRAYDLQNNQIVALKISAVDGLLSNRSDRQQYLRMVRREQQIHLGLQHPHIVQLLGVVELEAAVCLVLEFCEGPTLGEYVKREGRVGEMEAKVLMRQILMAVSYLSDQRPPVVHYDLKPGNLAFRGGSLKVLDFGICKILQGQHSQAALSSQGVGSYWYLPPQTFLQSEATVSSKVDIWSIGVIFYEILYGRRPFGHNATPTAFLAGNLAMEQLTFDPTIEVTSLCQEFIRGCLQPNPSLRFDPHNALAHLYFTQMEPFLI